MPSSPPQSEYRVIYADPPWSFATYSDKGKGRSAQAHYDCLGMDDLCKIPVREWAARNCALFLWTTDPLLPQALRVIEAWGFTYKTVGFYWAKLNRSTLRSGSAAAAEDGSAPGKRFAEKDFFTGLGFWTRANVEQCLLATRGNPKREAKDVRRLVIAPRREHSRKPEEVYGRIERLLGGPYLELFARGTRPGWDSWGDQAGLFDTGPVETRRFPSDLASGLTAPGVGD